MVILVCWLQHYSTAGADDVDADHLDISFTATAAADGTLLLGSSRDVSWDQAAPDAATVAAMLARAQGFLPGLREVAPMAVRMGLRPQVPRNRCAQQLIVTRPYARRHSLKRTAELV